MHEGIRKYRNTFDETLAIDCVFRYPISKRKRLQGKGIHAMTIDQSTVDGALVAEPGRGPEVLAGLQAMARLLDEVPGAVHQLGEDQEAELVSTLLRLLGRSAQVVTLVASDAVTRGVLVGSDAATTAQWLGAQVRDVPVEPDRKSTRLNSSH